MDGAKLINAGNVVDSMIGRGAVIGKNNSLPKGSKFILGDNSWVRIIKSLGWKPKHSFKEGLKETVEWYLENEWWWKPLADERILHPTPWNLEW